MRGFQNVMPAPVNQLFLGLCIPSPEQEDQSLSPFRYLPDHCIREDFPTFVLVGSGLVGPDGQGGIQQKHPLVRPAVQAAVSEHRKR